MKHPLSEVQLLVLQCLADGLTFEDIATRTGRDLFEVEEVAEQTRETFQASSDEHLVALALRTGAIK